MYFHTLRNLDHNPAIAGALGNMVIAWAHAETMLVLTLARITGIGVNMALTGYYRIPTFEARVKFLKALLSEWNTQDFDRDEIVAAIDKLSKLSRTRNHWVHGDWCANQAKTETVIFDQRSAVDAPDRRKIVKASDINHHSETVLKRTDALANLINIDALCT
jgi:hypothetical protein